MPNIVGFAIKNQWINFSLYFPNFMYKTKRNLSNSKYCEWILPINGYSRLKTNLQPIGGKQKDTQFLGHGENYQTDFIEINKDDFVNVFYPEIFRLNNVDYLQYGMRLDVSNLKGTYKRVNTGFNTNQETNDNEISQYYFLKGILNNNILQYLIDSKVI